MKLGAYGKWFGTGSIDGLDMFSGMTTYSMIVLKEKRWARLLMVGKGWSYCMIWWKEEIMDSWKIWSQTDQDGDRTASENASQKPAANNRRLTKNRRSTMHPNGSNQNAFDKLWTTDSFVVLPATISSKITDIHTVHLSQSPRSTQPGHPYVVRCNKYQPKGGDALRLGSKGRYGLWVGGR